MICTFSTHSVVLDILKKESLHTSLTGFTLGVLRVERRLKVTRELALMERNVMAILMRSGTNIPTEVEINQKTID
jgi:RIO-like serine/threonine protein kinase